MLDRASSKPGMWLALANTLSESGDELLRNLEAISRFVEELRVRLSGTGLDGLEGAVAAQARIRAALDAFSGDELDAMRARIATLAGELTEVAERLERLRRLKEAVLR